MKRILILTTVLTVSATVFAFGGGGHGRKSTAFTSGVDAVGVHINGQECSAGQELVDNKCMKKCTEGVVRDRKNNCSICENGNVYLSYNDDPCGTEIPEDFTGCKSNDECAENEYCDLGNTARKSEYPNWGSCSHDTVEGTRYTYNGKTFFKSYQALSWWSAANWCDSKGMKLVSLADTEIDKNNLGEAFVKNGYCNENGKTKCENVDWDVLKESFTNNGSWWTTDFDQSYSYQVAIPTMFIGRASRAHWMNFQPALCVEK